MDRAQKQELVDTLNKVFKETEVVVVTQNSGLTVAQVTELRRQMRAAGASFKVAKNRLVCLALEGTPYAPLKNLFKGPTGIAYANDPVAAAKVAVEFAKKNDKLVVIGGAMGETVLDAEGVKSLASLPSAPGRTPPMPSARPRSTSPGKRKTAAGDRRGRRCWGSW